MLPFEYGVSYPLERSKLGHKARTATLELCLDGVCISDGRGSSMLEPWRDWTLSMLAHSKNPDAIILTDKVHITCPSTGHLSLRAAVAADLLLGSCHGMPDSEATWTPAKDLISDMSIEFLFFKKAIMLIRLSQAKSHILVLRPEAITAIVTATHTNGHGYVSTRFFMDQGCSFYPTRFEFTRKDIAATFAADLVAGTNALRQDEFVKLETVAYDQFSLCGLQEAPSASTFYSSRALATTGLLTAPYSSHETFSMSFFPLEATSPGRLPSSVPPPPPPVLQAGEKPAGLASPPADQTKTSVQTQPPPSIEWATRRQQHFKNGHFTKYLTGEITLCHYRDVTLVIHKGWIIEKTGTSLVRAIPLTAINKVILDSTSIYRGSSFKQRFTQLLKTASENSHDMFLGLKTPLLYNQAPNSLATVGDSLVTSVFLPDSTIELKMYTGESVFYTFFSEDTRAYFLLQLLDFTQSLCFPLKLQWYRLHRAIGFGISMAPIKLDYFNAWLSSFVNNITNNELGQLDNTTLTSSLESLAFLLEVHPRTLPYDGKDKGPLTCVAHLFTFLIKEAKLQDCDMTSSLCIIFDFLILLMQSRTLYRAAAQDYYTQLFSELPNVFSDESYNSSCRIMLLTVIRATVTYQWRVLCEQNSNSYTGFSSIYSLNNDLLIPDLSCKSTTEVNHDRSVKSLMKAFQSTSFEQIGMSEGVALMASSFIARAEISSISGKPMAEIRHCYENNSLPNYYTQGITFSKSRFEVERENRSKLFAIGAPLLKIVCQIVSILHKYCKKDLLILLPIFGILDDLILFRSHLNQQWFLDNTRKAERAGSPIPQPPGRAELFLALSEGFADYVSLTLLGCRRISLIARILIKQALFEDVLSERVRANLSDYCLSSGAMLHYVDDVVSDAAALSLREDSLQLIAAAYTNNVSVRSFIHTIFPIPFLNTIVSSQFSSHKLSAKGHSNVTSSTNSLMGAVGHSSYSRDGGPISVLFPFSGSLERWKDLLKLLPTKRYSFNIIWDESVRANLGMLLAREITLLHTEAEQYISSMSNDALEKIFITNKPILGTLLSWNLSAFQIDLRNKSMFPLTCFDIQFNGFYLSYVLWHYISLERGKESVDGRHFKRELLSKLKLEITPEFHKMTEDSLKATDLDKLIASYFSNFITMRDGDRSIRTALIFAVSLILINSNSRFTQMTELATETIRLIMMKDYGLAGLCLSLIEIAAASLNNKYTDAAATGLHYYLVSHILPLLQHNVEAHKLISSVEPESVLASHTYGSLVHISLRIILGCLESQATIDKMGRTLIPVPQYKRKLSSKAFLPIIVNTLLLTQAPGGSQTFLEQSHFDSICYKTSMDGVGLQPQAVDDIAESIFIQTCDLLRELCRQSHEISQAMMECGVIHFLLSNLHGLNANTAMILLLQELYRSCSRANTGSDQVSNNIFLCLRSLIPEPLVLLMLTAKRISDIAEVFVSFEIFKINVVWTHEMRYQLYTTLYTWQQSLREALLGADEQHRIEELRFFGEYIGGSLCCVSHIHSIVFSRQTKQPVKCCLYMSATHMSSDMNLPFISSYPCIKDIEASLAGGIYTALLRSMAKATANVDLSRNDIISFLQSLLSISTQDLNALYNSMTSTILKDQESDVSKAQKYSAYLHSVLPPLLRLETDGLHEMATLCCTSAIDLLNSGLVEVEEMRTTEQKLRKEMQSVALKMGTTGFTSIGANSLQHPDIINQSRISITDVLRRLCILLIMLTQTLADGLVLFSTSIQNATFHPPYQIFHNYIFVCIHALDLNLNAIMVNGNSLLDDGWTGEAFSSVCTRAITAALRELSNNMKKFVVVCSNLLNAPAQTDPQCRVLMLDQSSDLIAYMYTAILALQRFNSNDKNLKDDNAKLNCAMGQTLGTLYDPQSLSYQNPNVEADIIVQNSHNVQYLRTLLASSIISYYFEKIQLKIDVELPPQVLIYLFTGVIQGVQSIGNILARLLGFIKGTSSVFFSTIQQFIQTFDDSSFVITSNSNIDELLLGMKSVHYGPKFAFDTAYKKQVILYFHHFIECSQHQTGNTKPGLTLEHMLSTAESNFTHAVHVKYPSRLIINSYHINNLLGIMVELNLAKDKIDVDTPLHQLIFLSKAFIQKFDTKQYIYDILQFLNAISSSMVKSGGTNMYDAFTNSVGTAVPLYAALSTLFYIIYSDSYLYNNLSVTSRVSLLKILCSIASSFTSSQEQLLINEYALAFLLHLLSIEDPQNFLPVIASFLPTMLDNTLSEGSPDTSTQMYIHHYQDNEKIRHAVDSFELHDQSTASLVKKNMLQIPSKNELCPRSVLCALILRSVFFVNSSAASLHAIQVRLLQFILKNLSYMSSGDISSTPLILLIAVEICSSLLRAQDAVLMSLLPPPLLVSLAEQNIASFYKVAMKAEHISTEFYWSVRCTTELIELCDSFTSQTCYSGFDLIKSPIVQSYISIPTLQRAVANKAYIGGLYLDQYLNACSVDPQNSVAVSNPSIAIKALCAEACSVIISTQGVHVLDSNSVLFVLKCVQALTYLTKAPKEVQTLLHSVDFSKLLYQFLSPNGFFFKVVTDEQIVLKLAKLLVELLKRLIFCLDEDAARDYSPEIITGILGMLTEYYDRQSNGSSGMTIVHEHGGKLLTSLSHLQPSDLLETLEVYVTFALTLLWHSPAGRLRVFRTLFAYCNVSSIEIYGVRLIYTIALYGAEVGLPKTLRRAMVAILTGFFTQSIDVLAEFRDSMCLEDYGHAWLKLCINDLEFNIGQGDFDPVKMVATNIHGAFPLPITSIGDVYDVRMKMPQPVSQPPDSEALRTWICNGFVGPMKGLLMPINMEQIVKQMTPQPFVRVDMKSDYHVRRYCIGGYQLAYLQIIGYNAWGSISDKIASLLASSSS